MDKNRRKALQEQYRNRKVTGGIYRLINRKNGRFCLRGTDDMQAARNWFRMCCDIRACTLPAIQEDWKIFGADAFEMEELDLLEKGEEQSREAFRSDIKALLEMWDEKLPRENRY